MTTNIAFATSDGYIDSESTTYTAARDGTGTVSAFTSSVLNKYGQNKISSTYHCYETFLSFPYTLDTNVVVVSVYLDLYQDNTFGTGVSRELGVRTFAWGSLTPSDWRTASQVFALPRIGLVNSVQSPADKHLYATENTFNETLGTTGAKEVVVYTSRFTGSDVPTGAEYGEISAVEEAGTSVDPCMVWTTVAIHTLVRVGNSQVQLSDGRHAFLEANTGGTGVVLALKYHDGTSATTIDSDVLESEGFGSGNQGMQSVTLVRDASDNLYVLSHTASLGNTLSALAWKKTGGSTWSKQGFHSSDMPANSGVINNLAAAWHSAGTAGTIMVVGSHESNYSDPSPTGQMFYALWNCDHLLNNNGSHLRGSGDAYPNLVSSASQPGDHNNLLNETGSCLDVVALPNSSDRGVVVSTSREAETGNYAPVSVVRYVLASGGNGISDTDGGINNTIDLWSTKDAAAKVRVLPISDSRWVVVTADKDTGWGPTIRVFQNIGTSSTFTELGGVLLGGEGIVSLPAPTALDKSYAWDAVYHPDSNKVHFWYFDTANGLRLMRTGFDLNTYQADKAEIQVQAAVGAGGSTNHAIRVQHGNLTESEVIVAVANKSSGGTQSTIYVIDRLNVAPSAPTLEDIVNYDATSSNQFDWTFNDLNVGDTQTAYEFQIDNADTLASIVATGKVLSTSPLRNVTGGTLTNGTNYRWRVRTWDTSDAVGAWSGYDFFTTAAGGTTTILTPASDNPAGVITDDYLVSWSVAGSTQAQYKVRVVRTSNEVQLSDTGWVVSTNTSHTISGLLSDVEYRIEVTTRNAALVQTNTATRLITANYNEPEIPLAAVTPVHDGGHISVNVTNPTPTGDKPEATSNLIQRRLAGTTEWTTVATVGYNGTYQDFNTGSGTSYEYQVIATASVGFQASAVYEATLALEGVWIHVPSDPAATAKNFRYGKNQRSEAHQSYSQLSHYAGREDPVADFAVYHDHAYAVVVDIAYGSETPGTKDDLMDLEESHQTLMLRDNRGRFAFGILTGMSFQDTEIGEQASFDFTRVSYDEAIV
jgi:hypothetical protein